MANRRGVPPVVSASRDAAVDANGLKLYGLDAELAAKAAAKYDHGLEAQAREFLSACIGRAIEGDMGEALKDGTILCEAMNKVKPGTIKRVNKSKMPFKQMENIGNFTRACRAMGMRENDLFTTPDLFEQKNMGNVVAGIVGFGRAAQKAGFKGAPALGAKEATANVRGAKPSWKKDSGMTKMMAGSSATMDRSHVDRSNNIVKDAGGAKAAGGGYMTKMMAGSSATMDRSHVDRSNNIVKDAGGAKASGGGYMTKMMAGSSATMDRSHIDRSNNIVKAGGVGTGGVSKWSQGSSATMARDKPMNTSYGGGYWRG